MATIRPRDARAEATARLGDGRQAVVLEPSPPAVEVGPWFADDPVAPARQDPAIVSPFATGQTTWADVVADDPSLTAFARDRWLAAHASLPEAPGDLATTRAALTALAFYVLAPARHQANGKIGLRWTLGGFGTPFFGADRQVRVEGDHLVVQEGDAVTTEAITTLRAAGAFVGVTPEAPAGIDFHDMPPLPDLDETLSVDAGAVAFLDRWFGFSTYVLERLRLDAGSPPDTRVQIWPEHFDPAIELGDADAGSRASYGASPGDADHPEPYLYVAPWTPREGEPWTASFGGAALPLAELRAAPDQAARATAFFQDCLRRLA